MRRRDQRRAAVFAVYQSDVTGSPVESHFERDATGFTVALANAVSSRTTELDAIIDRHAKGWSVDRISPLDKAILRVAILEITQPDAAGAATPIPAEGAVDEAVETAKTFCGTDAPGFINGILGAVLTEAKAK